MNLSSRTFTNGSLLIIAVLLAAILLTVAPHLQLASNSFAQTEEQKNVQQREYLTQTDAQAQAMEKIAEANVELGRQMAECAKSLMAISKSIDGVVLAQRQAK